LAPIGIELPVTVARETVAYFTLPDAADLPPLIEYGSLTSPLPKDQAYYALPAPGRGLKAGIHHAGLPADPDEEGAPDPEVVEKTCAWIARRYPKADTTPTAVETCLYTNTVDASFVIERHDRVVVVSACSGHGFKFAPVHGERVATLARAAAAL
jgi:sarcosine oxidase